MRATLLRRLYPRVLRGLPLLGTPQAFMDRHRTLSGEPRLEALVGRYLRVAGSTGFIAGLPGLLAAPVTVPADVLGTAALQLHLAAAHAHAADRDLEDPAVREACIACVLGRQNPAGETRGDPDDAPGDDSLAREERSELAGRTASKLAQRLTGFAFSRIGRLAWHRAGARLGLRRVPLVGGVVSAGANLLLTLEVAQCARLAFLPEHGASEEVRARVAGR